MVAGEDKVEDKVEDTEDNMAEAEDNTVVINSIDKVSTLVYTICTVCNEK